MPFEMSDEFPLISEHLGIRDFSRVSCQNTDITFQLDWLRRQQNSNQSLQRTCHNAPGTRLSSRASVLNGVLRRFPPCVNLIAAASSAFSVCWRRAARTRRTRSIAR
jgi:hypothetical protein